MTLFQGQFIAAKTDRERIAEARKKQEDARRAATNAKQEKDRVKTERAQADNVNQYIKNTGTEGSLEKAEKLLGKKSHQFKGADDLNNTRDALLAKAKTTKEKNDIHDACGAIRRERGFRETGKLNLQAFEKFGGQEEVAIQKEKQGKKSQDQIRKEKEAEEKRIKAAADAEKKRVADEEKKRIADEKKRVEQEKRKEEEKQRKIKQLEKELKQLLDVDIATADLPFALSLVGDYLTHKTIAWTTTQHHNYHPKCLTEHTLLKKEIAKYNKKLLELKALDGTAAERLSEDTDKIQEITTNAQTIVDRVTAGYKLYNEEEELIAKGELKSHN